MPFGFSGRILVINLTTKEIQIETLDEDLYRKYYGGYGLGVYYIYKNIQVGCDPLSPENILGFLPGLLTGSPAPLSGRYIVCAKSPLTGKGKTKDGKLCLGGWGNANSGGFFGPEIRKTGFDGIFFKGRAEKPIYLLLHDDKISLEDASTLWGKDTVETEQLLKEKHGKQFKVSTIGHAGENQILFSGIVTDGGRIAARSGLGAVMGSKNLKALCIKGKGKTDYANKEKMIEYSRAYNQRIKKGLSNKLLVKILPIIDRLAPFVRKTKIDTRGGGKFWVKMILAGFGGYPMGTSVINVLSSQSGDSPVKNFQGVGYLDFPMDKAMKLRGKNFGQYTEKQYGCYGCSVRCGAILKYEGLPNEDKETHRPEFETCSAFGPMLVNDDLGAIIEINDYLNRTGTDTLSAGNVVAFTLECVERGLLSQKDFLCKNFCEGFLPTWGDVESIKQLLKLIITREGIGNILAKGASRASEEIAGSEDFAITANGQELPQHDSRYNPGLALTYITDPTPGRHSAGTIGNEKSLGVNSLIKEITFKNSKNAYKKGFHSAEIVKFHQTLEALGFCEFIMHFGPYPYLQMIKHAFGWAITPEELLLTGHRIQTLRQMFNAREGAIRHHISQRAIGSPPQEKGPLKNVSLDLEVMVKGYYDAIGYTHDGIPLKETLEQLDLEFCLPDLANCTGNPEPLVNEYLERKNKNPYHYSLKF